MEERILHLLADLALKNEAMNIFMYTAPIKVGRESVEGLCNVGIVVEW